MRDTDGDLFMNSLTDRDLFARKAEKRRRQVQARAGWTRRHNDNNFPPAGRGSVMS